MRQSHKFSMTAEELFALLAIFAVAYKDGAFIDGRKEALARFKLSLAGAPFLFEDAVFQAMRPAPRETRFEAGLWALEAMGAIRFASGQPSSQNPAEREGRWRATDLGGKIAFDNVQRRWAFEKKPEALDASSKGLVNEALGNLAQGLRLA